MATLWKYKILFVDFFSISFKNLNTNITFKNIFRNDFNEGHTCITYDAINAAYLDARKRIGKFQVLISACNQVLINS